MQLVWFRNDLRISDNPALFHSQHNNQASIAIYIATPEQWIKHDDAAVKIDFWRRNLECLHRSLAELNIPLYFFEVASYDEVPELIISICQTWKITDLHFNEEYPINEQRRDHAVQNVCIERNIACHTYHEQLLLPPASVRTKAGEPFKVFSPFAKQARLQINEVDTLTYKPHIQSYIQVPTHAKQKNIEQLQWPEVSSSIQTMWPAGEQVATSNLHHFCTTNLIHDYKKNRDIPSVRGTSFLSPYLNSGVISVKQCWQLATQYCEQSDGATIWQNELLWREFYKHVLIDFPYICKHQPWKQYTDAIPWRNDKSDLEAWQQGKTGYPIIDAAMKQLLTCGWMHNRLRMVCAMFLSKHLLIDWRLGERWFMQHLVDGDLAANNGGWQWSASTGTDAVPYFRIFNPVTQSQRFDPQGKFIRFLLPQLDSLDDKQIHLPNKDKPDSYPSPIIDLKYGRERALSSFKTASN